MKTVEASGQEELLVKSENIVQLPLGLLGFERNKRFVLLTDPEEEPFMWLQMLEDPQHTFLVISPFSVCSDYKPDVSQDDVAFLGLTGPQDALVLSIVTLRPDGQATVNLKGPILLNRNTLVGKQVIPLNVMRYSLQHPVPVAA